MAKAKETPNVLVAIERAETTLIRALPKGVDFERLVSQIKLELYRNSELADCDAASLFWSFVHAAELGLNIGASHQEAYVVPFKSKGGVKRAQLITGYRGLEKLAYQHPSVVAIDAQVVHQGDVFDFDLGTNKFITFKPNLTERGNVVAAFAMVKLKDAWILEVLTTVDLERTRDRAMGSRSTASPWATDYEAMCRKTAIRRVLSRVPRSTAVDRLLAGETAAELGDDSLVPPLPGEGRPEPQSRKDALTAAVVGIASAGDGEAD